MPKSWHGSSSCTQSLCISGTADGCAPKYDIIHLSGVGSSGPNSDRAINSVGQSATFTRLKSGVRVPYRPPKYELWPFHARLEVLQAVLKRTCLPIWFGKQAGAEDAGIQDRLGQHLNHYTLFDFRGSSTTWEKGFVAAASESCSKSVFSASGRRSTASFAALSWSCRAPPACAAHSNHHRSGRRRALLCDALGRIRRILTGDIPGIRLSSRSGQTEHFRWPRSASFRALPRNPE